LFGELRPVGAGRAVPRAPKSKRHQSPEWVSNAHLPRPIHAMVVRAEPPQDHTLLRRP
jgi:hypothetical protein